MFGCVFVRNNIVQVNGPSRPLAQHAEPDSEAARIVINSARSDVCGWSNLHVNSSGLTYDDDCFAACYWHKCSHDRVLHASALRWC